MAKAESVRDLSEAEIQKRLADARQELFTLRLQRTSGKLLSPAKIVQTRRAVARLLTELRARELGGSRDWTSRRNPPVSEGGR